MNENYDDFKICSPKEYEQIAKKYSEQLSKGHKDVAFNSKLLHNFIKQNILVLENIVGSVKVNQASILQRIYVKSCSLEKYIIENFSSNILKQELSNKDKPYINNQKNNSKIMSIYDTSRIKKSGISNLCQILKLVCSNNINSQNLEFALKTIDLIEEYCKI